MLPGGRSRTKNACSADGAPSTDTRTTYRPIGNLSVISNASALNWTSWSCCHRRLYWTLPWRDIATRIGSFAPIYRLIIPINKDPHFNYYNRVREENRNFYIPYEADFSEGLYTARLSATNEPPAEF